MSLRGHIQAGNCQPPSRPQPLLLHRKTFELLGQVAWNAWAACWGGLNSGVLVWERGPRDTLTGMASFSVARGLSPPGLPASQPSGDAGGQQHHVPEVVGRGLEPHIEPVALQTPVARPAVPVSTFQGWQLLKNPVDVGVFLWTSVSVAFASVSIYGICLFRGWAVLANRFPCLKATG